VSDALRDPLRIKQLLLDRRLFMAPMAGVTTPAFRRSVRRWGAGLVFTEMISACGIHFRNERTLRYLECHEDEHPIGFQLFGADPAIMADAATRCRAAGADLIDINMACPVRKVVKTGAGAALLADPGRAVALVAAVSEAVGPDFPVTVKIRSGVREGDELGRRLAPLLVEAGAAAICIHPRTASQLYRGHADHAVTSSLAAELPVPVIASGDVDGRAAAVGLREGGAAAVMLARHALGRPWMFTEILDDVPPPAAEERLEELRLFVDQVFAESGRGGVGHLRQFWQRFRRSGTICTDLARDLMQASSEEAVRDLLRG
jgi:nifR3 family TIM-barrel protein